jgi:hypothetical protein
MASRRRLVLAAAGLAGVFGMVAMPAQAALLERPDDPDPHPLEFTRGSVQYYGLAGIVCEGPVKILQPTTQCAHYNPNGSTYHNPYTKDGSSPGILGLGSMFGLL